MTSSRGKSVSKRRAFTRLPKISTPPQKRPHGAVRLNARLRDLGFASRREADELIKSGMVFVNQERATLGTLVTEDDQVEVAGENKELFYEAYHKPRGLPTQGERREDSVVIRAKMRGLFPIGRLDKDSSGLLILTNDGRATTKISGEDSNVEKEYVVTTNETIRAGIPDILRKGMNTKIGVLAPAKAELVNERKIRITLTEGKRHQVRVMLAELGLTVNELTRVRIGPVRLGTMKPGVSRALSALELSELGL